MLRAYDKATGEEKGAVYMPAPQTGSPMTYMLGGRQYIVLAIGGGNYPAELLAFRCRSEIPPGPAVILRRDEDFDQVGLARGDPRFDGGGRCPPPGSMRRAGTPIEAASAP